MLKKYITIIYLLFIFISTLNAQEKRHFVIAIDPEYIPFTQKDIDGKPVGLLVDFWNLWADKNAYTVEYQFYPWEETLKATKEGKVDFHSGTTRDREWMYASNTIYQLRTVLCTLSDSKLSSVLDFKNKRLGTIDPYYADLVKLVVGDTISIATYDDYEPMVEALKKGEIDVVVDDVEALVYYFIKTGQMNRFKIVEEETLQFHNDIYAITNSKNSVLLKQINEGLKRLSLSELVKIEKIWLPNIEEAYYNKQFESQVSYSSDETDWLKKHDIVTLTGDPQWIPYQLMDTTYSYRGIVGDYIKVISQQTKMDFEIYPTQSWKDVITTQEKRSDVIFGAMSIETQRELSKYYDFLPSYESGPLVIIMDRKIRFVTSLYDIKTKKIGLLSEQEYTQRIESTYIGYDFHKLSNPQALLNKLKSGELDAVILSLSKGVLLLANDLNENLDIVGKMDEKVYVNIGILKKKPMLKNVLGKTLLSILGNYQKEIFSKWTRKLNYVEKVDYQLTYAVAGLLGLLLMTTGYYAYALKRKHQYAKDLTLKMEQLALTDDLTGLPNKRVFNQCFEHEHKDKHLLSLLFIDVDYFKKYNDHYGHLSGDRTLKDIAITMNSFSTKKALPYRIGGEEFALILYDYDEVESIQYAEEICKKIFDKQIEHSKSPLGVISVSIGVSIGKPDSSRHTLYQCADQALYAAKECGKNKVILSNCGV